ncbi:MAG: tRNA (adenosine(37)-N6)-threonylcarbamoyltransferase complex dimerization subunit type 1 TsaB [Micrococcales bacterium]|nr:tRNA (adenosine(37)-N6)-threonylcarbamoyltransferase complex dimerization subunit type 1 TsaB [Micrococcales bacterium]MCL2666923.1 tRNA (adenosine(37)-N6)-threonylcarbamoyltransferase complex dimerization subunit type 1 TsaB [Micrococcales bacterium]
MPYLALDTSGGIAVAVVDDDGSVAARAADTQPRQHAERLAPCIAAVLAEAGVGAGDLDGVVVGTGPAQFTGLRAGLVTARTLARALEVPVLGVPSFAATALVALETLDEGSQVVVVTDARRHEVYWARYARDDRLRIRAVDGPGVAAPVDVPTHGAVLVGRGAPLVAPTDDHLAGLDPDPAALCTVALALRDHGEPTPCEPLYLRRPDAVPPAQVAQVRQ